LPFDIRLTRISHKIQINTACMYLNQLRFVTMFLTQFNLLLVTNLFYQLHCFQYGVTRPTLPRASSSTSSPLFRSQKSLKLNDIHHKPDIKSIELFSSSTSTDEETDIKLQSDNNEEGVGAWIPLISVSSMKGLGPQRVKTMNLDLVVWHTPEEDGKKKKKKKEDVQWTVQVDACAHRLAPLSQGRVDPTTNCIECPYHGWQFDSQGVVTAVPQLDQEKSIEDVQRSRGSNVKTFPVHIVGDLLFVFLPSSLHGEMFPQSLLPEQYYPFLNQTKHKSIFVRELPYSVDFLIENFMDPAHIPFAHHKLQGTRDDGMPIKMKVLANNFTHVQVTFNDITRDRKRDAFASFQRPSFYHYSERKGELLNEETFERDGEYEPSLPIFLAPISAGKCRIFLHDFPIKFLPKWLLHAGSNRFLNSDVWLHDTEREVIRRKETIPEVSKKLCGMDYQYQSESDLGVSTFRNWWKRYGMADAPPHTFGMATLEQLGTTSLSRREQIDPWEHHAKHCKTCRTALSRMKKVQKGSMYVSIASSILLRKKPVVALVGVALGLFTYEFVRRFATVIEGNSEVSGIGDRSSSASS